MTHFRLWTLALATVLFLQSGTLWAAMVTVGNPGNAADPGTGSLYGAVGYAYDISTTEVSNAEYALFLNAVATTDTNALYSASMAGGFGGITQSGVSGSFSYAINSGRGANPVNFVSFYDSLRYANWLDNGTPTGAQDNSTTEDGAYTITSAGITANSIVRNAGATWVLTSEDEWYKAAYYDPNTTSYFDYATGSDTVPTAEAPAGGSNSANYNNVVGNTTAVGAYNTALSPYGTYDQSGNVFEWNEAGSSGRVFRGGGWDLNSSVLSSSSRGGGGSPAFENSRIGFRVASLSSSATVPEPGSLAVWSLMGVTGLWYRRRRSRK